MTTVSRFTDEPKLPSGTTQADGYADTSGFTEPVEEATELVEEMAATSVLNDAFDKFLALVSQRLDWVENLSVGGNPVRTHIALVQVKEDILTEIQFLRSKLIEDIANRSEEIPEEGSNLRKQIIDEES